MGQRIAVTGCAGFIGSRVSQLLLNNGYEVTGFDSLNHILYPAKVKQRRLDDLVRQANFQFVESTLENTDIRSELTGCTALINEAGLPGQLLSWDQFDSYVTSNLIVVERLISSCQDSGIKTFVQASTSSVYGKNAVGSEEQTLAPCSPYGVTKLAAEHLIQSFLPITDISFKTLRYFSVYGPGQRPDMAIHRFLNAIIQDLPIEIYGDGSQLRDCTFVDDIAAGTIACLTSGDNGGCYNLSSETQYSLLEILETCFQVANKSVPVHFMPRTTGDQDITSGNCNKAKTDLAYRPSTSLIDGISMQFESLDNYK